MEPLDRAAVKAPALASESVDMPSLGGSVTVRGCLLADTLALTALNFDAVEAKEGETPEQTSRGAGAEIVANTLAMQVVLPDGRPMWTAQEWLVHGGKHPEEVLALHSAAKRVNGDDMEAVAKN